MVILFYISGFTAITATVCVVLSTNPVYALLYLIAALLSIACNLFSLHAPFAGVVEIIIYAGAIMVLFIFAIIMLNIQCDTLNSSAKELQFLSAKTCCGVLLLMSNLLIILLYVIFKIDNCFINLSQLTLSLKEIGTVLFSSYLLMVEIASFLLLSALVSVIHIAQESDTCVNLNSVQLSKYKK